ncbi:unnamed protein product [Soboliphyme baturini]|uniref:GT23 domain-containing protein n=1 Tax=Soboliphyme baturini TaxID=241478 RepID=A0A183ITZ5_9BILA|nr:unnamed protein product [Soboliphyme baturini]
MTILAEVGQLLTIVHPFLRDVYMLIFAIYFAQWAYIQRYSFGRVHPVAHFDELNLLTLPRTTGYCMDCCGPIEPPTLWVRDGNVQERSGQVRKSIINDERSEAMISTTESKEFEEKRRKLYENQAITARKLYETMMKEEKSHPSAFIKTRKYLDVDLELCHRAKFLMAQMSKSSVDAYMRKYTSQKNYAWRKISPGLYLMKVRH